LVTGSYLDAKARHARRRLQAYAITRETAILKEAMSPDLRLADIDPQTLEVWKATWMGTHPSGTGRWNWPALVERLPRRAAVLPLAIWHGSDRCGLALGYPSRRRATGVRHTMTLTHVERRPEPPDVSLRGNVIPLAVAAAENYGLAAGATRLLLRCPDPNLLWYYESLGFEVAWKGNKPVYCEREI
jgi:hypothetical protein